MEFELKPYDEVMYDVFKTLCDEEIIDYQNTEPLRRCWIKTNKQEYFMRLWNMVQIDNKKIWIEAQLFN